MNAEYAARMVGRRINDSGHRADYSRDIKPEQRIEINQAPQTTNCLTTVQKDNLVLGTSVVRPAYRVRKLTQKECWRLMGFTDEDFSRAQAAMNKNLYGGRDKSGSQLYKQAGNSIVVDVLSAIMRELYTVMPYLFEDMVVGSFFSGIGAFEKALSTFDVPDAVADGPPVENDELTQVGYINNYNGDANRIYDGSTVARVLKAEAGGGGAKTGWYTVHSGGGARHH